MEKKKIVLDNSISEFIRQSITEIQSGLPDGYELINEIEFEVSVLTETNKKGELTFKIVSGSQLASKTQIQKINFAIANPAKQKEQDNAEAEVSVKVIKGMIQTLVEIGQELPEAKNANKEKLTPKENTANAHS